MQGKFVQKAPIDGNCPLMEDYLHAMKESTINWAIKLEFDTEEPIIVISRLKFNIWQSQYQYKINLQ